MPREEMSTSWVAEKEKWSVCLSLYLPTRQRCLSPAMLEAACIDAFVCTGQCCWKEHRFHDHTLPGADLPVSLWSASLVNEDKNSCLIRELSLTIFQARAVREGHKWGRLSNIPGTH